MKSFKPFLFATALTVTAATSAYASEDGGDTPVVTDAEALAQDAKAYAAAYDVSFDEAMRRMLLMHDNSGGTAAAESANAEQLAGAYFEHDNSFGYVVRVTGKSAKGPAKIERKAAKASSKADRKELKDLEKTGDKAIKRAERLAKKGLTEADLLDVLPEISASFS